MVQSIKKASDSEEAETVLNMAANREPEERKKDMKQIKIQKAALAIKKKYGKNAILKAMNLEEGATAKDRNAQIGGHKA